MGPELELRYILIMWGQNRTGNSGWFNDESSTKLNYLFQDILNLKPGAGMAEWDQVSPAVARGNVQGQGTQKGSHKSSPCTFCV